MGLSILDYLTRERLRLKELGKAGDLAAKQAEAALKVLINSLFGFEDGKITTKGSWRKRDRSSNIHRS